MFKSMSRILHCLFSEIEILKTGEVCIGFSNQHRVNRITAHYLKLLFETSGVTVQLCNSPNEGLVLNSKNISLYCAIIPSDFGTIRWNDYQIGEQTLAVIRRHPNCKVLYVYCQEHDERRVENLIRSIEEETLSKIEVFNFSDLIQNFFSTSGFIRRQFMPIDARGTISQIMADELVTVNENDRFSSLYFMMTALGIRHCPVVEVDSNQCVRIVSKRDLVQQIPPANLVSDDEASVIGLEKKKIFEALTAVAKKSVGEVFSSSQQLITVPDTDSIEKVVSLLAYRQPIGDGFNYISGVPVILPKERELVGFVSYTDILKFIQKHQPEFLRQNCVGDVATLAMTAVDVGKIGCLTLEDDLSIAYTQLKQYRSLPVVRDNKDREWVGFVDDLKVKMFSHKLFLNKLMGLSVKHFMVASEKLPVITTTQTLSEVMKYFLQSINGMTLLSTFVVTEKVHKADGTEFHQVKGVISYTDILKSWLTWQKSSAS